MNKSQKAKGESEAGEVDLNSVRGLKEKIVAAEAELANLRGLAGNLVPTNKAGVDADKYIVRVDD